jgi:hypothetical protein
MSFQYLNQFEYLSYTVIDILEVSLKILEANNLSVNGKFKRLITVKLIK